MRGGASSQSGSRQSPPTLFAPLPPGGEQGGGIFASVVPQLDSTKNSCRFSREMKSTHNDSASVHVYMFCRCFVNGQQKAPQHGTVKFFFHHTLNAALCIRCSSCLFVMNPHHVHMQHTTLTLYSTVQALSIKNELH